MRLFGQTDRSILPLLTSSLVIRDVVLLAVPYFPIWVLAMGRTNSYWGDGDVCLCGIIITG